VSILLMSQVWKWSASKGVARLVLLALADEGNDEGEVTAYRRSQSALAVKANASIEAVRKAIKTLGELGELVVLSHGEGRASSNYQITLRHPVESPTNEGARNEGARLMGAAPNADPPQPPTELGTIIPFSPVVDPLAVVVVAPPPTFEDFWTLVPSKERGGKGEAEVAWAKLSRPDRVDAMTGMRRHVDLLLQHPGVYVFPAGSVWLNKRRWRDDEPKRPPAPKETARLVTNPIERMLAERKAQQA
jgi:hypothetical protein